MKPFCRENMDYILDDEHYTQKMADIIKLNVKGLCKLIEWKHFDVHHPENHNICNYVYKDEGQSTIDIFNGKEWKTMLLKDVLPFIINRLADDIDNYLSYMEHSGMKINTSSFGKYVAAPLELDMIHVEYKEIQDNFSREERRDNIYKHIIALLKKKLEKKKNSIKKY